MAKDDKLNNVNTYLIIALVIVVGVGLYFTLSVPVKEAPKPIPPREVMVTILQGCDDCFNISVATDFLKQQKNINITSTKILSLAEAKAEAGKYGITKLPAVIVTGDITNLTIQNFDKKDDALVFNKAPPPYYDVSAGTVKGKVTLTIIEDKTCTNCFDMSKVIEQLQSAGIKMASTTKIDSKSAEGKQLISQYKIEKVPTLIFNNDALEYDVVKQVWDQVGSKESDGMLVLRLVSPPYVNVSNGKVEGLVEMTILTDNSCKDCYNASTLQELFGQSFGIEFKKTKNVDVSSTEGKTILKKYSIELVPTVILSKEANVYPNIQQAWKQVGSQEKDGALVFRNVPLLEDYFEQSGGKFGYKNITSGEVMPKKEEAEITAPEQE